MWIVSKLVQILEIKQTVDQICLTTESCPLNMGTQAEATFLHYIKILCHIKRVTLVMQICTTLLLFYHVMRKMCHVYYFLHNSKTLN